MRASRPARAGCVDDPSILATTGVEEFIRWVSPLLNMARTATEDHELHGVEIKAGDELLLMYASANRDERVLRRSRSLRRDAQPQPSRRVRVRHSLLSRRVTRTTRDPRDVRRAAAPVARHASRAGRGAAHRSRRVLARVRRGAGGVHAVALTRARGGTRKVRPLVRGGFDDYEACAAAGCAPGRGGRRTAVASCGSRAFSFAARAADEVVVATSLVDAGVAGLDERAHDRARLARRARVATCATLWPRRSDCARRAGVTPIVFADTSTAPRTTR